VTGPFSREAQPSAVPRLQLSQKNLSHRGAKTQRKQGRQKDVGQKSERGLTTKDAKRTKINHELHESRECVFLYSCDSCNSWLSFLYLRRPVSFLRSCLPHYFTLVGHQPPMRFQGDSHSAIRRDISLRDEPQRTLRQRSDAGAGIIHNPLVLLVIGRLCADPRHICAGQARRNSFLNSANNPPVSCV
jgi:hypothetical protein